MTHVRSVATAHVTGRIVAGAALVTLCPVLVVAAVAVKVFVGGPVLYPAARIGISGRPFVMLKLRTMRQLPTSGTQRITGGRDPRIGVVGRLLRRLKIDELPQLVNVVRGDMVLVGPRPEDPTIVSRYYTDFMLETLSVVPGLTSPGSLDYFAREGRLPADPVEAERVYVSTLLPRKAALDLVYVRNRSWRYDLQLIVRTAASLVGIRGCFHSTAVWEGVEAQALLVGVPTDQQIGGEL